MNENLSYSTSVTLEISISREQFTSFQGLLLLNDWIQIVHLQ